MKSLNEKLYDLRQKLETSIDEAGITISKIDFIISLPDIKEQEAIVAALGLLEKPNV